MLERWSVIETELSLSLMFSELFSFLSLAAEKKKSRFFIFKESHLSLFFFFCSSHFFSRPPCM